MAAKTKPVTTAIIQLPDACPPEFPFQAMSEHPSEITKFILVDFGVAVPSPATIEQMEDILDFVPTCQPFSRITYLDGDGKPIGSMSSAAKGYSLNDRRWDDGRHYCQRGILAVRRMWAEGEARGMIPGEITSPIPTPYVPPVIEPAVFVELPPVYAIQDPSELYTDPIRILPEELANLDTPPKP